MKGFHLKSGLKTVQKNPTPITLKGRQVNKLDLQFYQRDIYNVFYQMKMLVQC